MQRIFTAAGPIDFATHKELLDHVRTRDDSLVFVIVWRADLGQWEVQAATQDMNTCFAY